MRCSRTCSSPDREPVRFSASIDEDRPGLLILVGRARPMTCEMNEGAAPLGVGPPLLVGGSGAQQARPGAPTFPCSLCARFGPSTRRRAVGACPALPPSFSSHGEPRKDEPARFHSRRDRNAHNEGAAPTPPLRNAGAHERLDPSKPAGSFPPLFSSRTEPSETAWLSHF